MNADCTNDVCARVVNREVAGGIGNTVGTDDTHDDDGDGDGDGDGDDTGAGAVNENRLCRIMNAMQNRKINVVTSATSCIRDDVGTASVR